MYDLVQVAPVSPSKLVRLTAVLYPNGKRLARSTLELIITLPTSFKSVPVLFSVADIIADSNCARHGMLM